MIRAGTDNGVVIECRDLRKDYATGGRTVRVLDGVELSVRPGEIVAITGRTGAGKSTLLALLGGLDRPTSGTIVLSGRRVDGLGAAEWSCIRRREIGFLFQNLNLLAAWTAVENVEAAMLHTGVARAARREAAAGLLAGLGLADKLDYLPGELSAGQQQLVAVARAMANEPRLLLADEPTGDVDDETAADVLARLIEPVRTRGAALVVATHGAFPLAQVDRAFVLAGGTLTATEPARSGP